ncbi:hypothetical protein VHEMI02860 [[Torrubiella] hemipterigena]|uniref:2EXR domain-containing protein n=1 Tax=[Torrubiella] hemipterigena TaxID=1531966 RepID=A0A0A1SQW1_9HYPO|nr:hypothetical protein VHEMI02860 [[Torrubiella] hemipterigena]
MAAPLFPSFTRLPRELRDQIWYYALPDDDSPALFSYVKGFVRPFIYDCPLGHKWYGHKVGMRFYHEELDPVPVDAPLLHVNAESASAAIAWAEEKGYIVSHDMEKDCPAISRRMDRHHDILYFPPGEGEELAQDIWDLNGIHHKYFGDWWMPTQYAISEMEMLSAEKAIASIFSCDDTTCCLKAAVAYVLTAERATILPKAEFTGRIKAQRWSIQPGNERALEFDFTSRTFHGDQAINLTAMLSCE